MKKLSMFIKDEYIKDNIDIFFENNICIESIDRINKLAMSVSYGNYANIVFKNSLLKERFLEKLSVYHDDLNVINCNCTIDRFFENSFNGFLVFNNLKHCKYKEIIEEISKHNAVLIC